MNPTEDTSKELSSNDESKVVTSKGIPAPKESIDSKEVMRQFLQQSVEMTMQQGNPGLDLNTFNDKLKSDIIEIMRANEDNSYKFHTEKLKSNEKIKLTRIAANNFLNNTNRIIGICALIALFIITIIILLVKDQYLINWLTFVAGLGGGFGIGKINFSNTNKDK